MKGRVLSYLLVAWIVPPLIAAGCGWTGVWGSGNVLLDFLLPLPISTGALHVPSVAICAVLLAKRGRESSHASVLAGYAFAAVMLAGVALLVDMNDIVAAMKTDAPWPGMSHLLSRNPLGLFLLCDGLLALLWMPRLEAHTAGRFHLNGMAIAVAVPVLTVALLYRQAPVARYEMLPGTSLPGPSRGDAITSVYTTLDMATSTLVQAWQGHPLALPPDQDINAEDLAIYFFDSYEAAKSVDLQRVRMTWCRYEDGTPERWSAGTADCFADHQNFSERFEAGYFGTDPRHSPDARRYFALQATCRGVTLDDESRFSSVSSQRLCADLSRLRQELIASDRMNDFDRAALARESG